MKNYFNIKKIRENWSNNYAKSRLITFVVVVVVVAIIAFIVMNVKVNKTQPDSTTEQLPPGTQLEQDGKLEAAANSYKHEADQLENDDVKFQPTYYETAGDLYLREFKIDEAIESYRLALEGYRGQEDSKGVIRVESKLERAELRGEFGEEAMQ